MRRIDDDGTIATGWLMDERGQAGKYPPRRTPKRHG